MGGRGEAAGRGGRGGFFSQRGCLVTKQNRQANMTVHVYCICFESFFFCNLWTSPWRVMHKSACTDSYTTNARRYKCSMPVANGKYTGGHPKQLKQRNSPQRRTTITSTRASSRPTSHKATHGDTRSETTHGRNINLTTTNGDDDDTTTPQQMVGRGHTACTQSETRCTGAQSQLKLMSKERARGTSLSTSPTLARSNNWETANDL